MSCTTIKSLGPRSRSQSGHKLCGVLTCNFNVVILSQGFKRAGVIVVPISGPLSMYIVVRKRFKQDHKTISVTDSFIAPKPFFRIKYGKGYFQ